VYGKLKYDKKVDRGMSQIIKGLWRPADGTKLSTGPKVVVRVILFI
jgi:hypothetical protein